MKRKLLIWMVILSLILGGAWWYSCSLVNVKPTAIQYFHELYDELEKQGYRPSFYVTSGKRHPWHNYLLNKYGGAAKKSRHLKGEAIDIIVLDVNKDGAADAKDVDIVYNILDRKIVGNKGGVGTYKNNNLWFDQQMVHFDCRGYRARWHR